jgi:hypothetical protein
MSIVNEALVLNLQIRAWTGYKLDKEKSREVTDNANAEEDAARVNKHLIPRETLKPITAAASALRLHLYSNTLPWKDNGDRLLPRRAYQRFIEEHEGLRSKFVGEVADFCGKTYAQARERAEFRMGDMFKPEDYPTPEELESKFSAKLDIDPVATAHDFRVNMDEARLLEIQSAAETALKERIARASKDVWGRLSDKLEHLVERMEKTDERFRESTLTGLLELAETLPDLNFMNDPGIDTICQEIKYKLAGFDAKSIRKHEAVRKGVSVEAQAILDNMRGLMNAFGPQEGNI